MLTVVAARLIGRDQEAADPEVGHTDLAAVTHTPIESQSRTKQSVSLEAFVRHGCPKDLN